MWFVRRVSCFGMQDRNLPRRCCYWVRANGLRAIPWNFEFPRVETREAFGPLRHGAIALLFTPFCSCRGVCPMGGRTASFPNSFLSAMRLSNCCGCRFPPSLRGSFIRHIPIVSVRTGIPPPRTGRALFSRALCYPAFFSRFAFGFSRLSAFPFSSGSLFSFFPVLACSGFYPNWFGLVWFFGVHSLVFLPFMGSNLLKMSFGKRACGCA